MMNKPIQNIVSTVLLILMILFSGIGIIETITKFSDQSTIDFFVIQDEQVLPKITNDISTHSKESSEYISGDLSANLGELCVFQLSDPNTRADWIIVPETKFYIDSSGSSLVFSSNVPSKYTIIAAIVEDGQSKILTHVIDYGVSPNPSPTPIPNPNPEPEPVTLSQWVQKNIPPLGYSQVSALATCYESVVTGIENGTIKSQAAAYSLIRTATQTKINIEIWQPFLGKLSVKVTEKLDGSDDVQKLGLIFKDITEGLKAVHDDFGELENRYIPDEIKKEVFIRDGGQCLCCGIKSGLEYDHIYPYSKGGQNTFDNLQLLCRRCNASKGTGTCCKLHDKDLSLKP
jgi:hypothetical protein